MVRFVRSKKPRSLSLSLRSSHTPPLFAPPLTHTPLVAFATIPLLLRFCCAVAEGRAVRARRPRRPPPSQIRTMQAQARRA